MRSRPLLWLAPSILLACSGDEPAAIAPSPDPCRLTEPAVPAVVARTPRWAFEPWISKDISDAADTYAFVQGFRDRDIPVGAVVLDSPWETQYNTFVPSPTRYPDFDRLVTDMHGMGVRVVLWTTQLVNVSSFDLEDGGDVYAGSADGYDEAQECGFFVDGGASYGWWKGTGSSIDFFNPSAVAWWHARQDHALDLGIDGWKLDFGDSYVASDPVETAKGSVPHQEYSEAYYRDFYAYGVHRRGPEFVTMVRAYDRSYSFEGRFFARPEDAPVAWMGDNRRDWVGLEDALDEMFRSAQAGYAVLGSDIGGYLDRDDQDLSQPVLPVDPVNFARWTAMGALSPFMQLHGRANLTPWTVPQEDKQIEGLYRYWAKLHHELVPFFYSLAMEAQAGGAMIVRPVGTESQWPGDYRYELGDALLVAPIVDDQSGRAVELPEGALYYDWWAQSADPMPPQTVEYQDIDSVPRVGLYAMSGAIVPLAVEDDVTGLGTAASAGKLTVLVYPAEEESQFSLHEEDGAVTEIRASGAAETTEVEVGRVLRETLLRIRVEAPPAAVLLGGEALPDLGDRAAFDAGSGWFYEAATKGVWVKIPPGEGAALVELD